MNATDIKIALAKHHTQDFFITECNNGPSWSGEFSRMDAVAIKKSYTRPCVTIYEVKVSKSDFLHDNKWPGYLDYCHRFYFACPSGLIQKHDIPDPRVGLVWVNENGGVHTVKPVSMRPTEIPGTFYQYLLYSRLDSERTPFYSDKVEYIQAYLKNKTFRRGLAGEFSSAMKSHVQELEKDLAEFADQHAKAEQLDSLMKAFWANGFYGITPEEIPSLLKPLGDQKAITQKAKYLKNIAQEFIDLVNEKEKSK